MELHYAIAHYINPQHKQSRTHPDPIDRIWALRKAVKENGGLPQCSFTDEEVQNFIDNMIDMKSELEAEYLPFEIESFEHCGSIYLEDSRSKPLVDRFDY